MTVGDRIRKLREERRLTQEELAKFINSTKQTIYKYENNIVTNIPSDKIEGIAKALNTTPSKLMGWDLENVKSILDNNTFCEYNRIYPMNDAELIARFRNILFNIGVVGINPSEPSNEALSIVVKSDEFKKYTKYLIDNVDIEEY